MFQPLNFHIVVFIPEWEKNVGLYLLSNIRNYFSLGLKGVSSPEIKIHDFQLLLQLLHFSHKK